MEKTPNKRAKRAVFRGCAAILAAVILLVVTGFAFVDMLRGSEFVSDITQLSAGDYVTTNVDMILGYFAEEYNGSDEVTALYAVVPCDQYFAVVILPERYFDSGDVIYDSTYAFINGETAAVNDYILVTGTAEELTGDTSAMFYDWFGLNKDWMTEAGLIDSEVEDYANHLSLIALRVDRTGRLSTSWSLALSAVAWALLMYAMIVFLRLSLGKYAPAGSGDKPGEGENAEKSEKPKRSFRLRKAKAPEKPQESEASGKAENPGTDEYSDPTGASAAEKEPEVSGEDGKDADDGKADSPERTGSGKRPEAAGASLDEKQAEQPEGPDENGDDVLPKEEQL